MAASCWVLELHPGMKQSIPSSLGMASWHQCEVPEVYIALFPPVEKHHHLFLPTPLFPVFTWKWKMFFPVCGKGILRSLLFSHIHLHVIWDLSFQDQIWKNSSYVMLGRNWEETDSHHLFLSHASTFHPTILVAHLGCTRGRLKSGCTAPAGMLWSCSPGNSTCRQTAHHLIGPTQALRREEKTNPCVEFTYLSQGQLEPYALLSFSWAFPVYLN